jgi:hypothetical protein
MPELELTRRWTLTIALRFYAYTYKLPPSGSVTWVRKQVSVHSRSASLAPRFERWRSVKERYPNAEHGPCAELEFTPSWCIACAYEEGIRRCEPSMIR